MIKKKFSMHVLSFIFKLLCTLIIASVVGVFVWRIFASQNPKSMKRLIANEKLCQAYAANDGDLTLFKQDFDSITRADHNSGYFSITSAVFIDEADQVQVVLRYNNSTLKHIKEDYSLSNVPDRDTDIVDVTLIVVYDETPDDKTDNSDTSETIRRVRYYASGEPVADKKNIYNYRKFVFDGIDTDKSVIAVYADFYYKEDINYEKEPYGSLRIYHAEAANKDVSLKRADKKNIEAWLEENK
ncbi:MAG: hypothetical protein E7667_02230 [Ruminococcaceae bacterium]|nr:hypothetical protein [Oscillospiraceae bacterium]